MLQISLVWFGAAVSLAEILTGTELAGLGFKKGLFVILLGHIIGCGLMVLSGLISVKTKQGAMKSSGQTFGIYGARFFAILNVLQLVGWQGIMIYDAAISAEGIYRLGHNIWSLIIGLLTIAWILTGIKHREKLNYLVMTALLILTVILSRIVFFGSGELTAVNKLAGDGISFGMGLELSIAMPLSWLPMIGDYTYKQKKGVKATLLACGIYSLISGWMYVIGLGAATITKESRIDNIMLKAGLGVAGLFIIVFSCVTTNFIDAYSCNQSAFAVLSRGDEEEKDEYKKCGKYNETKEKNKERNIENNKERSIDNKEIIEKKTFIDSIKSNLPGIIDTIIGTVGAMIFPMDNISGFLYLIGSVFAPMIAVEITDFFIVKNKGEKKKLDWIASAAWIAGFIIYRLLMKVDIVVGYTIPAMLVTMLITLGLRLIARGGGAAKSSRKGVYTEAA